MYPPTKDEWTNMRFSTKIPINSFLIRCQSDRFVVELEKAAGRVGTYVHDVVSAVVGALKSDG